MILIAIGAHRGAQRRNTDWRGSLQLLLREQILPVLILALELIVGTFNGSLLFLQLANLLLEHLHLVSFLQSAAYCALTVLQSLASFFVLTWILGVIVGATSVSDGLLEVLLLLLGQRVLCLVKTSGLFALLGVLLRVVRLEHDR